ncbi:chemotaxis protein CheA [Novosphingobium sp.]|uniref:chemotaxis protein CheA n=1 Tax=Novosphingobium sp. TaxID=1874826 RepID=UPI003D0CF612
MTIEDIQAIFFAECDEALAAAEQGLAACHAGLHDDDTINAVFRGVHSIKGGAGAFGYGALQSCTHGLETLLSDVRDGAVPITPRLVGLLLRALDRVGDHVVAARQAAPAPEDAAPAPDDAALIAELTAARTAPAADDAEFTAMLDDVVNAMAAGETTPPWTLTIRPHAGAMANGGEPLLLLREVLDLGGACLGCDTDGIPPLEAFDPGDGYLAWHFAMPGAVTEAMVRDVFEYVGDDCGLVFGDAVPRASLPAPAAEPAFAAPPAPPMAGPSIRIDLARLYTLVDAVGELLIAQAMMAQRVGDMGARKNPALTEALTQMEGLTRDIQDTAMALRAQPIGTVFSRVPRILRELQSSTGKQVHLIVSGETTELDKTVIERLGEPLTHLIRNAVDHGIEPAADRLALGKPAHGTLTLSAEHRSGRILIRIGDDGRGIDRARVRAKAIDRGVIAADAVLGDDEIDQLIFAPGFSTAPAITNLSGRGVGLDVVRQMVKDLGGRITIDTKPGSGTTFTLALPLTLAIADGMVVTIGDQTLVVPLAHVVESLRPAPAQVKGLGAQRVMIDVRGRFVPVVPLHQAIGAAGAVLRPDLGVLIVVETESAGPAALLVDAICDQRQVVIKSLDTHFRKLDGVAGATILGNGRVALILDVDRLVARHLLETPVPLATAA